MCLVEIEKFFKFVVFCVLFVMENMEIFIDIFLVKKVCEVIIEFLLINYLFDCLICD